MDELFGSIFAGNGTTATTICWALKFLTSHPPAQIKPRTALRSSFPAATTQERDPTVQEIVRASIPYLDATMEEILRCAGTSPFVNRQATTDRQIPGHRVPRGTIVLCLLNGLTMWFPGFDMDERRRYVPRGEGAPSTCGRGDKPWDPENMFASQPERWLVRSDNNDADDEEDGGGIQFDPIAGQLAFGLGPRGCFGRRLVYLELRIFIMLLVWKFELLACPEELSSVESVLKATNEPRQSHLRLSKIAQ